MAGRLVAGVAFGLMSIGLYIGAAYTKGKTRTGLAVAASIVAAVSSAFIAGGILEHRDRLEEVPVKLDATEKKLSTLWPEDPGHEQRVHEEAEAREVQERELAEKIRRGNAYDSTKDPGNFYQHDIVDAEVEAPITLQQYQLHEIDHERQILVDQLYATDVNMHSSETQTPRSIADYTTKENNKKILTTRHSRLSDNIMGLDKIRQLIETGAL
ncbi:MAG: hypothetical protein A2X47_08240 [Lentisphaerae bacterium GWF2_38_69]|nr:MAG: hypothetical protein A2X47_08240 [Lentisphaerae bacterium GWF2_38_69]